MMNYSFIIPVYNCKPWLAACVDSIRAAELAGYEILLVDDGSTDGSGALCDELAAKYPGIRVIHKENGGVSSARNRGIDGAEGAYILFLDSDDTLDAAGLAALAEDFPVSGGDMAIFGMSFDYYRKQQHYRSDVLAFDHDGLLRGEQWRARFWEMFNANAISSSCTKIFKRSILDAHQIRFSEDMFLYEDLEFVLRYLSQCDAIFNVPQAIYHYRQSEDEGNAKRRVARIDCLSDFLAPLEAAVNGLAGVPDDQKENVLVLLHQVLAREKSQGAGLEQIRRLCGDYAQWYSARGYTAGDGWLHRCLVGRKAMKLMLQNKKSALRHKIAVWVKSHYLYRRK